MRRRFVSGLTVHSAAQRSVDGHSRRRTHAKFPLIRLIRLRNATEALSADTGMALGGCVPAEVGQRTHRQPLGAATAAGECRTGSCETGTHAHDCADSVGRPAKGRQMALGRGAAGCSRTFEPMCARGNPRPIRDERTRCCEPGAGTVGRIGRSPAGIERSNTANPLWKRCRAMGARIAMVSWRCCAPRVERVCPPARWMGLGANALGTPWKITSG